jgi:hypothetical protein
VTAPRRPLWAGLQLSVFLCVLLPLGCVGAPPAEPSLTSPVSAAGPVVLVHGIWPDSVSWWVDDVQAELHDRGVRTLATGYTSFVFGYLTGLGTDGAADRVAATEHALRVRHARTDCSARLALAGIGYSAGTAVLAKAAERGARFERLYFGGSPIPAWSGALATQLEEDRIGLLVNYCSLLDGVANLLFGAGALGFHGAGPAMSRVDNRWHWRPHWLVLWDSEEVVSEVVDEIVAAAEGDEPHSCFADPAFEAWFLEAKRRLRVGEDPPGSDWRAARNVARSRQVKDSAK